MRAVIAAAAITGILLLLLSVAAAASPEKQDKFGCHRCTAGCEKYGLVKDEFHCHGSASVQSQGIHTAPRIYGDKTYRRVANVLDGDTLTVYYGIGGRKEKIRLLNIDAPEKSPIASAECYSRQAAEELEKLAKNKFVMLEKDKLQKEDKDKYGRLLRYIILFDNTSVNEEMVKGGHAKAYPSLTSAVEYYKKLENEAKAGKKGMWGECAKEKKTQPKPGERLFPMKGERYGSNNMN